MVAIAPQVAAGMFRLQVTTQDAPEQPIRQQP